MSFGFFVQLNEAMQFAEAYEKVAGSVSGQHNFSTSYEFTTPANGTGPWLVNISCDNHRTFMELLANMHLEMPELLPTSPPAEKSEETSSEQNIASEDDSWPGAAIGEGVGENSSDLEDAEFYDDKDGGEEGSEEEDSESDDEDAVETVEGDDKKVVKLKRTKVIKTGNSAISVVED